jgi:hypothetical protein
MNTKPQVLTKSLASGAAGVLLTLLGTLAAGPVSAATVIFSNDFSSGLTSAESVSGIFSVGNGFVGNQISPYGNNASGAYKLTLNFLNYEDIMLSFDYWVDTEEKFDPFYVRIGNDILVDYSGMKSGPASLNLSSYVSGNTKVGFYFNSDSTVRGNGVRIDNVLVSGRVVVPGPIAGAGLPALLALGGFVWARRRKAAAVA